MDKSKPPFVVQCGDTHERHRALLTAENAHRMRAGVVTLAAGDDCGVHSTEEYEEILIILAGEGEARITGHSAERLTPACYAYIPPRTTHCVYNTGLTAMKYVYVVAPADTP